MRSGRLRCWRVTDCTPISYCNSRRPGRQFRRPSPALRPAACQCVISRKTPASGCGTFMGSAYSRYASLIRVCQPRSVQKPRRWEAQSFHFFIPVSVIAASSLSLILPHCLFICASHRPCFWPSSGLEPFGFRLTSLVPTFGMLVHSFAGRGGGCSNCPDTRQPRQRVSRGDRR
jgi:hypothetical protein